jgi:hypothetical protein
LGRSQDEMMKTKDRIANLEDIIVEMSKKDLGY